MKCNYCYRRPTVVIKTKYKLVNFDMYLCNDHVTISFNLIQSLWFERGQKIFINSDSVFFQKIIEMEYKEIFDKELNLHQLHEEIHQLRNENELLKIFKSKNRNHG